MPRAAGTRISEHDDAADELAQVNGRALSRRKRELGHERSFKMCARAVVRGLWQASGELGKVSHVIASRVVHGMLSDVGE